MNNKYTYRLIEWTICFIAIAFILAILFGCATQKPRLNDDDFKTKGYFDEG